MKMVKSLLLGSAAGFVAIAGAQAADLPVKAKPVEYVKVCSVYGAGFYYIPGTDTCIKLGGFVRAEWNINSAGTHGPYIAGGNARDTRVDTNSYIARQRGILSIDTRSQTEWGTLRSYMRFGVEQNSTTQGDNATGGIATDSVYRGRLYSDRAFIQFAGITVGKTQSFFDFYANALNYTTSVIGGSDTGHGITVAAYTAQFGGGFSATVSLEDSTMRRTGMWDASTSFLGVGVFPNGTGAIPTYAGPVNYGDYSAQRYPDIVANLRVDQPWGSAQVMAAVHDASGGCYTATCFTTGTGANTDGPNNTGWAVGAGVMFNLPWAQGDQFWVQGTWARGAASYIGFNKYNGNDLFAMQRTSGAQVVNGSVAIGSIGMGWAFDGIFQTGGPVELTEGFQVNAAAQHYWTPALRTSIFGGYAALRFPGTSAMVPVVAANPTGPLANVAAGTGAKGAFCTGLSINAAAAGPTNLAFTPAAIDGCNPDFAVVQVGTRTIWSPVANLDIGVEVLYTRLDQNMNGNWLVPAQGSRGGGYYTARDQDTWSGVVRFQRNFWP